MAGGLEGGTGSVVFVCSRANDNDQWQCYSVELDTV